jgi:ketosteroid isomerase-like protein
MDELNRETTEQPQSPQEPPRRRGFGGLALVLVLVGLAAWFVLKGTPGPSVTPGPDGQAAKAPETQVQPGPSDSTGPQAVAGVPTAEATAALRSQLEKVLVGIREANQEKDLSQLLSHYSPNFPQLTQRAQSISKTWKIYDYPKMDFTITELKVLAGDTVEARVTWDVEAKNISTQKSQNISKAYWIRFVKESGHWRIKALNQAG